MTLHWPFPPGAQVELVLLSVGRGFGFPQVCRRAKEYVSDRTTAATLCSRGTILVIFIFIWQILVSFSNSCRRQLNWTPLSCSSTPEGDGHSFHHGNHNESIQSTPPLCRLLASLRALFWFVWLRRCSLLSVCLINVFSCVCDTRPVFRRGQLGVSTCELWPPLTLPCCSPVLERSYHVLLLL